MLVVFLIEFYNFRKKCEEERKRKEQQLNFVLKESEAIKHHFKKKIESVGSHVEDLGNQINILSSLSLRLRPHFAPTSRDSGLVFYPHEITSTKQCRK